MRFQFFRKTKPQVISQRKNKLIWYFRSSFKHLQLYFLLLQSTDTFFLISHRYKLSICSVHAMSILFMLAQATAYNLFKLDDDSINDKLTFED